MPLAGSPYRVAVVPAEAAALRCVLGGAGLAGGVVKRGGEARHLTLTAYDLYGNRCTQGGAQVTLSLQPRDAAEGAAAGAAGAAAGTVAGINPNASPSPSPSLTSSPNCNRNRNPNPSPDQVLWRAA